MTIQEFLQQDIQTVVTELGQLYGIICCFHLCFTLQFVADIWLLKRSEKLNKIQRMKNLKFMHEALCNWSWLSCAPDDDELAFICEKIKEDREVNKPWELKPEKL